MDQCKLNWTKVDVNGLNRLKCTKMDSNGPKWTEMDRTRPNRSMCNIDAANRSITTKNYMLYLLDII